MATLDKESVRTLSKLARIQCSDNEIEALMGDLAKIVDYVELLAEVDTDGVAPCNRVVAEQNNVMREDVVERNFCLSTDDLLKNAPDSVDGMVRVPSIIKKHS